MSSVYEIRLSGVMSQRLLETLCSDFEMKTDTVLYGVFQDQSALHGLLARVRDHGLELVDVRQVTHMLHDDPPPTPRLPTPPAT